PCGSQRSGPRPLSSGWAALGGVRGAGATGRCDGTGRGRSAGTATLWSTGSPLSSLRADAQSAQRLPSRLADRRHLRRPQLRAGRAAPADLLGPAAPAGAGGQVRQRRVGPGPRRHHLVPEPGALLHLRPALRHVRRRGPVPLPVGDPPRVLRGVRPHRDVHLHLRPTAGPPVRLAQGGPQVGLGLVESGKMPKPLTDLLNMSRKYSIWVYQWGLACCAIEMGAAFASPRYDVMRLGVIPLPAGPRQTDLVVISGTVTDKMAPSIKRLYEQMP